MKFYAITALLIAAVTVGAASLGYLCLRSGKHTPTQADALLWLRTEFDLSADQLARIEESHQAYSVICAEHCAMIQEQRTSIAALKAAEAPQPQLLVAQEKARSIDAHCMASVEAHAREIAAIIGGEQGKRYLKEVLPRLAHFDHATAPDLMLNSARADAPPTCH